jgi:hypothetical protein
MRDLGYNEKGELNNVIDDEDKLIEEEKDEDDGVSHTTQDSIHRVNKVADSTLDFIDKELDI